MCKDRCCLEAILPDRHDLHKGAGCGGTASELKHIWITLNDTWFVPILAKQMFLGLSLSFWSQGSLASDCLMIELHI